ncbi:MAG: hypothetical protein JWR85_3579 [Marmoricola sp.]|nr:hypothetical protein [Marmoricola sp.]
MTDRQTAGKEKKLANLTGGSRKGIPNKKTAAIKDMILTALETVGGAVYLAEQAQKNPGPFMALVGKVLPLQVTGEDGAAIRFDVSVEGAPPEVLRWMAAQRLPDDV